MKIRFYFVLWLVFVVPGLDQATGQNFKVTLTVNQGEENGAKVSALTTGSKFAIETPVVTKDATGNAAFKGELKAHEDGRLLISYSFKLKLPVIRKLPELSGSGEIATTPDMTYEFLSAGNTRCLISVTPQSDDDSPDNVVLLTGFASDNVVSLNLESGEVTELISLEEEARPRGIAQNSRGDIYVSVRGADRNILKFSLADGNVAATPITKTIGRYGPAQLIMSGNDELFAACDSTHEVRQFSGDGELKATYKGSVRGNVCGIAIHDGHLFSAHLFQGIITRMPLSEGGDIEILFKDREVIDRPYALAMSHDGHLLASAYEGDGRVRKIDRHSGKYLGDFLDLKSSKISSVSAMLYHPQRNSYLVCNGNSVIEFGIDGKEIRRFVADKVERVVAISEAKNTEVLDHYKNVSYSAAAGD